MLTPNLSNDKVFYLEDGYIRNFITTENGDELSIDIISGKTILPLISLIESDGTDFCFYETLTSVNLRVIPKIEMFKFLENNPEIKINLTSIYSKQLSKFLNKAKQLVYKDSTYRIITTLINLSETLGISKGTVVDFSLRIPHELIASFSGTTRETATRKLGELKTRGIIQTRYGRLKILKLNELQKLINYPISH